MTDTPTPVICQVNMTDSFDELQRPCVTVEMRSTDPSQKDSMANVLCGWLAQNWDELFLIFRAQLKAHEQERTGAADLATSTAGPRILNADGRAYTTSDDIIPQAILFEDGTPLVDTSPATYEPPVITSGLCYDAPAPSPSPDYSSSTASAWSDTSSSYSSSDSSSYDSGSCSSSSSD